MAEINGQYTWGTPSDVLAYQRARGLKANGIVNPKTAADMASPYGQKVVNNLYNSGLSKYNENNPQYTDSYLFNNGKTYTGPHSVQQPEQPEQSFQSGLAGFSSMTPYQQNQALYDIGDKWHTYTPEQQGTLVNELSALDTSGLATPDSGGFSLDSLGGMKGLADIAGGVAALGGMYTGMQQNKMAREALDMKKAEYARQMKRDQDFSKNIAASGLGKYSAG